MGVVTKSEPWNNNQKDRGIQRYTFRKMIFFPSKYLSFKEDLWKTCTSII